MAISTRGIRNLGQLVPLGLEPDGKATESKANLKTYIGRELGVDRNIKKEESLIKAAMKPDEWLDARKTKLDSLLNDATDFYQKRLAHYYNAGYSAAGSEEKAQNETNSFLKLLMSDLDDEQPGASTIFASAANKLAGRETQFMLANGRAESDKEIYKRIRAQKKAKKAMKSQKAITK